MHASNGTDGERSLEARISKVKKQLDRLSNIITGDKALHENTVKALLQCQVSSSSEANSSNRKRQALFQEHQQRIRYDEDEYQQQQFDCQRFHFQNSLYVEIDSVPNQTIHQSVFNRENVSQESQYSTNMDTKHEVSSEMKAVDVTIKKGKQPKNAFSVKKKDESQISSSKGSCKLKNVKSEKKFLKKRFIQPELIYQKPIQKKVGSPACKIFIKEKQKKAPVENRVIIYSKNKDIKQTKDARELLFRQTPLTSASQARGLSSQYHLNLKKEVSMKINDLKIKKMLCQKQSEYLSAAIRITKEEIQKHIAHTKKFTEESFLKIFTLKSIVRFFTQFTENSQSEQDFDAFFMSTLQSPNRIIKFIVKLPDILRSKSVLSEERCQALSEQCTFLQQKLRKMGSGIFNKSDVFCNYVVQLHHYIDFLLDNDMVHQTKRRNIYTVDMQEFFSDRSKKEKKAKHVGLTGQNDKRKEYDTERKVETQKMRRINTAKLLSPKTRKVKKEK